MNFRCKRIHDGDPYLVNIPPQTQVE